MPKLIPLEQFFSPIYTVGARIVLKAFRMPIFLIICIYFSFFTTMTANLMCLKAGKGSSHSYEVFLDTTIFISILNQVTLTKLNGKNLSLVMKHLLEPLKKYPKHTRQYKIIRQYKKRISICALAMTAFTVLGNIFHYLKPLATLYWSSNQDTIEEWPLPLGKVPIKLFPIWIYGIFYVLSVFCTLVSSFMYVCWFFIMVCSTFHMMTKLKLLSLEVKALNKRAEEVCEYRLSFLSRQNRSRVLRRKMVDIFSLECLKEVVKEHIQIMGRVRLLENSYRWTILGYCRGAVFITALALMTMVDEWKVEGTISTYRINITISTLFFIFVNSYSGQIIITESENLRAALCGINWVERSTSFISIFKVMMTVTQKPLRLTGGTVFTLSMESYCKTMEAVYSFVNFLIPLRK